MTIYDLKPAFQALLRPGVNGLARRGVTPNQITLAAALLSLLVGTLLALFPQRQWPLLLVPVALFLRMALNAVDGMLAREHGMQTRLGAVLNELGDVLSDTALYLPFALVPGVSAPLIVLVTLLAAVGEMAGVVAVQIGAKRRYDGPMGKSDRAFVFGALALALGLGVQPAGWLDILLVAVIALLAWTIINRARGALRETP